MGTNIFRELPCIEDTTYTYLPLYYLLVYLRSSLHRPWGPHHHSIQTQKVRKRSDLLYSFNSQVIIID